MVYLSKLTDRKSVDYVINLRYVPFSHELESFDTEDFW